MSRRKQRRKGGRKPRQVRQKGTNRKQNDIHKPASVSRMTTEQTQVGSSNNPKQHATTPQQPAAENLPPGDRVRIRDAWQYIRPFGGRINWGIVNAILTLGATVAIAIFTGYQVKYGNLQWDATDKQWKAMLKANVAAETAADAAKEAATASIASNRIAEETAAQQLRAYVDLASDGEFALFYSEEAKSFASTVTIKNSGQTPARNVEVRLGMKFDTEPDVLKSLDPKKLEVMQGRNTIGPDEKSDYLITYVLAEDEQAKLPKKEYTLFIYGTVDYVDAFGKPHFGRFIVRDGPQIGPNKYTCIILETDGD